MACIHRVCVAAEEQSGAGEPTPFIANTKQAYFLCWRERGHPARWLTADHPEKRPVRELWGLCILRTADKNITGTLKVYGDCLFQQITWMSKWMMSRSANILWLTQFIFLTFQESLEQQTQQNLCFTQFTPRRNLFTQNLTPVNYDVFFHMLKHCFLKRNAKLIHQLQ